MSVGVFSDKRRNNRVVARIPVTCDLKDTDGKTLKQKTAVIGNLSTEGIYLLIDEILSLKTEVNVSFFLPQTNYAIRGVMRVTWVEALDNRNNFGIGAAFINLNGVDKEEIKKFVERLNIRNILGLVIEKGGSDLHLLAHQPPVLRINGELETMQMPPLHPDEIMQLIYSIMTREQIKVFEKEKELDFGLQYDLLNRFRVNVHQQRGFTEVALRLISSRIFSFEELKIPDAVKDLARNKDGLILIVGPTGSGKTTTIATIVDLINHERKALIITLERPIEYVYETKKSVIKQREVGIDTNSFSSALRSSLRQDPNVIVVGELDEAETVKTALIASEAGYLVIASFHAPDIIQAIDRLVSFFPVENRKQILSQLANCLKGVIAQFLLPRKDKKGRVLASEVLINNDAVKRNLRKDELFNLSNIIQTGSAYKMQSMDDSIRKYVEQDIVDTEIATFYSQEFRRIAQH